MEIEEVMTYCERVKPFRYRLTTKLNAEGVIAGIRHSIINVHRAIAVVFDINVHHLTER